MGFVLLGCVALALADDVAPDGGPVLSGDEWSRLRAGEVVVRADTSGPETVSTGFVLVNKDQALLWTDVLDLKARIPENGTLRDIAEYRRISSREWFVEVDMEVFGVDVQFANHWICTGNTCSYTLDESRPSDLTVCDGYYRLEPVEGQSLLTYHSRSRHRVGTPGWVRRWLAIDGVENLLRKLKARAER